MWYRYHLKLHDDVSRTTKIVDEILTEVYDHINIQMRIRKMLNTLVDRSDWRYIIYPGWRNPVPIPSITLDAI